MAHPHHPIVCTRGGFTLVELLATVAIIAVLVTAAVVYVPALINWAQQTSDERTLLVLNDALNRYKCEGGNVAALTSGAAIKHVISALRTPVTWSGMSHQFLEGAFTRPARSIFATGNGALYHFTQYNTYAAESGGSSPTGNPVIIYLTTTGDGTWTVPTDWNNSNNSIECIGGGGNGGAGGGAADNGGGGGGAYAKVTNLTLTPGASINVHVGPAADATWFNATSLANAQSNGTTFSCAADNGRSGTMGGLGVGGQASNSTGTVKFSGGSGGTPTSPHPTGGGGAGGPYGNGADGGPGGTDGYNYPSSGGGGGGGYSGSASTGGGVASGGNNHLNTGGGNLSAGTQGGGGSGTDALSNGYAGGNGVEWDASHGSGGGGGGSGFAGPTTGGVGGLYGGGGGAGGNSSSTPGTGAQGIIVITYTP